MALSFVCDSCGNAADYFINLKIANFGTIREIRTLHRTDSCVDDVGDLVVETMELKEKFEPKENEAFHSIEILEIGPDDANDKDINS